LNGNIELNLELLNKPSYSNISNLYYNISSVTSTTICSGINLTEEDIAYSLEIRYFSDGYVAEFFHIQRADVEESKEINLYDLKSNDSTEFKIIYQDSSYNFVDNAIIQLQRKYISENIYETVEAPLTSSGGTAIVHVDLNTIKYRATIVKNGEVLDEFENLVFDCESELTGECTQELLGNIDPGNEGDISDELDFYYSEPTLSNNTISLSFSIPSGLPSNVKISLEQKDEFGNKTLCNQTIISSAGSIECEYSEALGRSYIDLKVYKDDELIVSKSYIIEADSGLDWLGNNYIFMLVIILSLAGMAVSSPEWIIINGVVTFVISGALYLARGLDFVAGLGIIIWLVIASIILIAKIAKQEDR